MMKPPFKASNGGMYHHVHCVVCGFIKLYKHDFEVMKYISYVIPTCAISGLQSPRPQSR